MPQPEEPPAEEEAPKPAPPKKPKPAPPKAPPPPEEADLPLQPKLVIDPSRDRGAFTDDQLAVLRALQGERTLTAEELVEAAGIPARRVLSTLTLLQIRQLVAEEGAALFHPGGAEGRTLTSGSAG